MISKSKKILILQHISCEGLGSLGDFLEARGALLDYRQLSDGDPVPKDLKDYSALISLGGPMNVDEEGKYPFLRDEIKLLKMAVQADFPTLGVCLGAQLIAKAAGAKVTQGRCKEIGWYSLQLAQAGLEDPLFKDLPQEFMVFQWHGDTFEIPKGASPLASSDLFPHQAFRLGRRIYGIQFHVEVTSGMIENWIRTYEGERLDPKRILQDTKNLMGSLENVSRQMYNNLRKIWKWAGANLSFLAS